jgi:hypothetical protein
MKIIISENQYKDIISKITGGENNDNLLNKLKRLIGKKDNEVGNMVLNSVLKGNYRFVSFDSDDMVTFTIKNFPFVIVREYPSRNYVMTLPLFNRKELSIDDKILKKIFYNIAEKHMDIMDYIRMQHYDSL